MVRIRPHHGHYTQNRPILQITPPRGMLILESVMIRESIAVVCFWCSKEARERELIHRRREETAIYISFLIFGVTSEPGGGRAVAREIEASTNECRGGQIGPWLWFWVSMLKIFSLALSFFAYHPSMHAFIPRAPPRRSIFLTHQRR
jgi:hypothetical protein